MRIQTKHVREGHESLFDLSEFISDYYWEARPDMQEHSWYVLMLDLIQNDFRVEGYSIEDGVIVSVYIANPAVDPHYGEIAAPVVDWVNPYFRGNKAALRVHSELRKEVSRELGASRYLTVKHINNTTQVQRVRPVYE